MVLFSGIGYFGHVTSDSFHQNAEKMKREAQLFSLHQALPLTTSQQSEGSNTKTVTREVLTPTGMPCRGCPTAQDLRGFRPRYARQSIPQGNVLGHQVRTMLPNQEVHHERAGSQTRAVIDQGWPGQQTGGQAPSE